VSNHIERLLEATCRIYPSVQIGVNAQIGDFVIIGHPPRGREPGELPTVIGDNAIIRSHTIIYASVRIGHNFQTGHGVMIREENDIGDDVSIGTNSIVEHHVVIGNSVRLHSRVFVPEYSILEDECWLGPGVIVTNALHPRCPKVKECMKGATVRRGAKIGAGAVLLPDIEIGEMALVGAGAVVVKDVPPRAVVAGNPAKVIKGIDALTCPYDLIERPY
jgi:acetyltransferase-like isoleucine patch superfamily enzyme